MILLNHIIMINRMMTMNIIRLTMTMKNVMMMDKITDRFVVLCYLILLRSIGPPLPTLLLNIGIGGGIMTVMKMKKKIP